MRSFLPRLSASLLAATFMLPAPAQQKVCLSLHGGPATGFNNTGGRGQVAARVEGVQVAIPTTAGMTAAQASAAHEAAFAAAGFTTERVNATEFCVTRAPGNQPITRGLCYGTDDTDLDLDSKVSKIPPPADPKTKDNGAVVPLPPVVQPPQPFGGVVTIYIYVRIGNITIRICIQILLQPNLPGPALQQSILQQLQGHGFLGNRIRVPDPLRPTQLIEVFQLERTTAGDPVVGIEYQYDAMSRRILPDVTGAGLEPTFGLHEYGTATMGTASRMPWSRGGPTPPMVNSFFDVFHNVELPLRPGGLGISLVPAGFPVLNGVLLVDPSMLAFEFGFTDSNGTLSRHWTVPPTLSLVGLPICSQGMAFDQNLLTMTTGMRAVIGPP
ncbi:MAG: hypothetical protein IPK26_08950 [Planctomycetes bacterium]|nr:hypothetical protein [Planctomycetota bacterium]